MNRYPLWRYLLLLVIVVLGLVYAAPNLYGEDPAVQISGQGATKVDAKVQTQVKVTLDNAGLPYNSIEQESDNSILVRFKDTPTQLKAKDFIKAALGDQYTVALNLASKTPEWLTALGAAPMKLGLDLRGGVYFLINVDVGSLAGNRLKEDSRTISEALRKDNIRYSGIKTTKDDKIVLQFRDASQRDDAYTQLHNNYQELQFVKADDKGPVLEAQMTPAAIIKLDNYAVDQTMTVLRKRVNELGVAEAVVQRQGPQDVAVSLPGIQDTAQAKQILGGTATLEFHIVDAQHDVQSAAAGDVPFGSKLYKMTDGSPILLKNRALLKGSAIVGATSSFGQDGRPIVNIRIAGPQVSLFHRSTGENVGQRMGIVFVETKMDSKIVDGKVVSTPHKSEKVISAPVIQSALGNNFQITGLESTQVAQNLALLLRAGALIAPLSIIEENTMGPSLGKQNIHKGFMSIMVGFLLVVLFITLYYRFFGIVANIALAMNVILVVAILSLLGAVLTLPGIAGIVLTVGMAIDANVLIFERIREELRNGMTPQASIHAGYARAFTTIVDANVTTLIVAVLLFALGTGPIKGFAVTLTVGLLTSMLTALTGTRAIVNLVYGGRVVKKLSIGIKVPPMQGKAYKGGNA